MYCAGMKGGYRKLGLDPPRGHCTSWIVPSFEPSLCESPACDHARLRRRSICGACGYRIWLTEWEMSLGLDSPSTKDCAKAVANGTFDRGQVRVMQAREVSERSSVMSEIAFPEAQSKQAVLDVVYTGEWGWGMFSWEQMEQIARWRDVLADDFGQYRMSEWAECAGIYYWPRNMLADLTGSRDALESVPPIGRRTDCLIAFWYHLIGQVAKWSW